MKTVSADSKLNGFAQKLPELASQLAIVYDMASNLTVACYWYNQKEGQYGGPPKLSQLQGMAEYLYSAYMNIAALTGVDPCEQFEETKAKIVELRKQRTQSER